MKTQVTQTSIEAYHAHQGKQTQCERIARHILAHAGPTGITLNEIAVDLNMREHVVSARLNALKKMQTVYVDFAEYEMQMTGKRKSRVSGMKNEAWALLPKVGQLEMKLNRTGP